MSVRRVGVEIGVIMVASIAGMWGNPAPAGASSAQVSSILEFGAGCSPKITYVSEIAPEGNQTIFIEGDCLGTAKAFSDTDTAFLRVTDSTKSWNACSTLDDPADSVTCSVTKWTNSEIVMTGFDGAYGSGYQLTKGDDAVVQVYNPQTDKGPSTFSLQVGIPVGPPPSPPKSNRTSPIATSLATPHEAFHSLARTVLNAVVVLGAVLFITFPAQIFNDTLDENYEEILAMWRRFLWRFRGKRWKAKRVKQIPTEPSVAMSKNREVVTFASVLLVGSVIGGYRDPAFGFNLASLANLAGTLVALAALIGAPSAAATLYRKTKHEPVKFVLRAIPLGLVIAVLSVAVSRLSHFEPGYLYGLVCGVAFAHKLKEKQEGHIVALESGSVLVLSVLAWLAFVPVDAAALRAGSGFFIALIDDLLGSVVVGGLVGVAIGLLPLRFLPGGVLYKWSRAAWGVLMAIALFGIAAIMLNPSSAPVNNGSAPIVSVIILFIVFGGGSLAFRQFFASRRPSEDAESRVTAPTGVGRFR